MTELPDVFAVNRTLALALMEDDETVPITNWYDDEGEECESGDAIVCVAGPTKEGQWLRIDLTEFGEGSVQ